MQEMVTELKVSILESMLEIIKVMVQLMLSILDNMQAGVPVVITI